MTRRIRHAGVHVTLLARLMAVGLVLGLCVLFVLGLVDGFRWWDVLATGGACAWLGSHYGTLRTLNLLGSWEEPPF